MPTCEGQKGNALVQVLLLSAILYGLVAFGTRTARTEVRIASNHLLSKQALAIAEAGLNHTFDVIRAAGGNYNDELSSAGAGGALTALGNVVTVGGVNYRFRSFGGGTNDGYYVRVVDNYDEEWAANDPMFDRDGTITIISRGWIRGAERVIRADIENDPLLKSTLFGKERVSFMGDSMIDSFDSRVAPYDPATANANGDVRSNGYVSLSGTSTLINGDATAGTYVAPGTGTITGTTTQNAQSLYFPSVPRCAPYSPYSGFTCLGSCSYDAGSGDLSVSGGNLTLAAGTYCLENVSFTGGASLTVSGPVRIFLNNHWDTTGGSIVNTTTISANLQLLVSDVCNNDGVKFAGGATTYMSVYAPDTKVVLTGGTDFYGAILGKQVVVSGGTQIHYDEALRTIPSGNVRLARWHELRTD